MIHMMAAKARTENDIASVHNILRMVAKNFFCLRCREHFRSNMAKFPPPKVNDYNELFTWTVEMHNKVNRLNDKPCVTPDEALEKYVGSNATCTGDCGAKVPSSIPVSQKLITVLISGDRYKFKSVSDLRSLA